MAAEVGATDADGNPRVIRTELTANMMTTFYQGYVHTSFNPDCEAADTVFVFGSEDMGIEAPQVLISVAGEDIDSIKDSMPEGLAFDVEQCMDKCGLKKRTL